MAFTSTIEVPWELMTAVHSDMCFGIRLGALLVQRLDIHGPVSLSLSSYGSMKDTVVGDTGERC